MVGRVFQVRGQRAGATFVGRQLELAGAAAALDDAARAATWLVVEGEPGIGKTRLLAEVAAAADDRGHLVLTGRGAEFERGIPFGMWVDALDDYLGALGPAQLRSLVGDSYPELTRLFPSLAGQGAPGAGPSLPGEQYPTHRAVRTLLTRLATDHDLLLILDDLHWADPASVALLTHLLRRPPPGPILIAVAYRTGKAPGDVVPALEAAVREGTGQWLALRPLSRAQTDELLDADSVARSRWAGLHRDSGGNPFYLHQLARVVDTTAVPQAADGKRIGVPPAVAAALEQELTALSPTARLLARSAAVAGEPCDLDLMADVAELDAERTVTAIDELVGTDLLRTTEVPRRYRFRHPIVRRAVYHDAGEGWRIAAHGRAAAALGSSDGTLAARAHHLDLSARQGDNDAIGVLVAAADQVAPSAPAAAARCYTAALRLLNPAQHDERLTLTATLGVLLLGSGDIPAARARLLEALALNPPDAVRAELATACATAENLLGDHRAAHARLVGTLAVLTDARSVPAATVHVQLALVAMYECDHDRLHRWAAAALELAEELHHPGLVAVSAALVGFALCWLDPPAADAVLTRAAAITDDLPDDELATCISGVYYVAFAEVLRERFGDAARHLRRGVRLAQAPGHGQLLVLMLATQGWALDSLGEVDEAVRVTDRALELAEEADITFQLGWVSAFRCWTAGTAGDTAAAADCAAAAIQRLHPAAPLILWSVVQALVAEHWLITGDPDRCVAGMAAAGVPDHLLFGPGRQCYLYELLATAELVRGDRVAARRWVGRAERLADGLGLPVARGAAQRARAALLLHDGSANAAAELALAAADSAGSRAAVIEQARSWTLAGRAFGAAGNTERALAELRRAEATLTARGALSYRDEAATHIRRLTRPSGPGEVILTAREQQIAELVAGGRTNRQIANAMFVSEKTIESTMTRIFRKVGVRSRAALATAMAHSVAATTVEAPGSRESERA